MAGILCLQITARAGKEIIPAGGGVVYRGLGRGLRLPRGCRSPRAAPALALCSASSLLSLPPAGASLGGPGEPPRCERAVLVTLQLSLCSPSSVLPGCLGCGCSLPAVTESAPAAPTASPKGDPLTGSCRRSLFSHGKPRGGKTSRILGLHKPSLPERGGFPSGTNHRCGLGTARSHHPFPVLRASQAFLGAFLSLPVASLPAVRTGLT